RPFSWGGDSRWAVGVRTCAAAVATFRYDQVTKACVSYRFCPACVEYFRTGERAGRSPGAPDGVGAPKMTVLAMVAWFAAAVSLWLGAGRVGKRRARGGPRGRRG